MRHDRGHDSAKDIFDHLKSKSEVTLQIQKEIGEGRSLMDTTAGSFLYADIKKMSEKHDKEMAELKEELEEVSRILWPLPPMDAFVKIKSALEARYFYVMERQKVSMGSQNAVLHSTHTL